ncbi:MAG: DUF4349 domain-containing protein [Mycobacteriales bacterium]
MDVLDKVAVAEPQLPARRRRALQVGVVLAALLAGLVLVQGLGGGSSTQSELGPPKGAAGGAVTSSRTAIGAPAPAHAPAAAAPAAPAAAVPQPDDGAARVVKTGTVVLLADHGKVGDVAAAVQRLAVAPGYVADQSSQPIGSDPSATVTLRVPVGAFDAVLAQVQHLGAKVVSVSSGGRDVTATYADTQAQIGSLQAARARFLTILSGARTIPEILTVQQRVDDVQGQIDRLEAQRRVLADQSDLATVTVSVSERAPSRFEVARPRTGLALAWDRARHGFTSGLEGLVARSGTALLVLLVALVLLGLGRLGWRLARRRLLRSAAD